MNYVLERVWKDEVMVYFKVLSQNFPGGSDENHDKPQSSWPTI
jgi:hypothetical protein